MENYHALLRELIENGQFKPNRTGTGSYASVGHTLQFDLRKGFPAITTKKLNFAAVRGELLGFFRGYDNAAQFRGLGCKVWDQNANETSSWLASEHRKGHDDLGRIYGVQWTGWRDTRYADSAQKAAVLVSQGFTLRAHDVSRGVWVLEKTINQLESALRTLLADPYNRRVLVTGWRPDELQTMALPPCHVLYSFTRLPDNTLNSCLFIRSNDVFLGNPFNSASLALFTHVMARLVGCDAGTATVFIADAHVYENHLEQAREQLSRAHLPAPRLVLSERVKRITDPADIEGAFARIEPQDITLEDYEHHAPIKAPMAV